MKDSSAPQAPNPEVTIPLQGAENRKTFDYQLGQMRTGTEGPTGSTSWSKTPVFDQAGYDAAMSAYNPGSQGTWVPDSYQIQGEGEYQTPVLVPGHWQGASGPTGDAPSRDDYTTYNWTQKTTLSPEQQALYDSNTKTQIGQAGVANSLISQLQSGLAKPLDFSGAPSLATAPTAPGLDLTRSNTLAGQSDAFAKGLAERSLGENFSNTLADAAYRQQTRYLDPQIQEQKRAMEARLADQGFVPGTPGYDQAMRGFMDSNARSYGAARDSAISQGYSQGNTQLGIQNQIAQLLSGNQTGAFNQALGKQGQLFSQGMQSTDQQNRARAQAISEILTRRNQPMNELAALRGGTGVQMPGGSGQSSTPNLQAPDLLGQYGQQYQGQLGQYGANVSSNNQMMSGLASLAALFLAGSDRRLKTNIVRVGTSSRGNPWYTWDWKSGGKGEGVIADEVPWAAVRGPDGYLMVDYSKV